MTEQKREIAKFTKQMVVCKTALFLGRPGRGQMSERDAYRVVDCGCGWLRLAGRRNYECYVLFMHS